MAEAAKLPRELFPEVIEGETVWERSGWKVRDLGMNVRCLFYLMKPLILILM